MFFCNTFEVYMSHSTFDRRQLLKGALLGLAGTQLLPATSHAADLPPLSENDPTAKALAYYENAKKVDVKTNPTYKPNQLCSNCVQLQAGTGARRGCNLFAGKSVNVNGWCKVWVQKP